MTNVSENEISSWNKYITLSRKLKWTFLFPLGFSWVQMFGKNPSISYTWAVRKTLCSRFCTGKGGTALYSSGGGCYIGLKRKNEKREIDSHKPVPVLMTLAKADIQAVAAAVEVSCATDAHAQSVSALVNYWPTMRRVSFTECFNNWPTNWSNDWQLCMMHAPLYNSVYSQTEIA